MLLTYLLPIVSPHRGFRAVSLERGACEHGHQFFGLGYEHGL